MIFKGVAKLREYAELRQDEYIPSGVAAFDELVGGLAKGGISEFFGSLGSGKRSLILSILSGFAGRVGLCAIVDASNSFDPVSAEKCGADLDKILWIKCSGDFQKAIISADYLVRSGAFNLIWLDLSLCGENFLQMLPGSYWYRYKMSLKDTSGAMIVSLPISRLGSAAKQSISVKREKISWRGGSNFKVFDKWSIELSMSRPFRKSKNFLMEAVWW